MNLISVIPGAFFTGSRKLATILIETVLLGATVTGCVLAQRISYSGNMQYATGSYFFSESTHSLYLVNSLNISEKRAGFTLYAPFIVQNTPWISYGGTGNLATGGPQHEAVHGSGGKQQGNGNGRRTMDNRHVQIPDTASYTTSSFGDPVISVRYNVLETGRLVLNLNGEVKVPLADPSRGFGTGAWDAGLGGSVSQRISGWFLTLNAIYWWLGDMQELELQNALSYGAGLGKSLGEGQWLIMGSFNAITEIISGIDPPISLGVGVGRRIGERSNINGSVSFGMSESSSSVTAGVGWEIGLN